MREVVHRDRNGLWRVAWRFQRLQAHVAEFDEVAVGEGSEAIFRLRRRAQIDRRARAVAQLQVAGDEIRVKVREEDVCDRQAVRCGKRNVLIDVALGIHDGGGLGALVANQIRRMGEAAKIELLEDHEQIIVLAGSRG